MAHEIQTGGSFAKLPLIPQLGRDEEPDEDDLPRTSIPVIHNYQHDLESLWWIIFFIGVFYTGHKPSITFCQDIFVPYIVTDAGAKRSTIFTRGFAATAGFQDCLHPDLRQTLFRFLDIARYTFYSRARNREASALQDPAAYSAVCVGLLGLFEKSALATGSWGLIPLVKPESTLKLPAVAVEAEYSHSKPADASSTKIQVPVKPPPQEDLRGTKKFSPGDNDVTPIDPLPVAAIAPFVPLPGARKRCVSLPARTDTPGEEEEGRAAKRPRRDACSC